MADELACMPRDPRRLLKVIAALDVEHNDRYLPGKGLTWCNRFVADATSQLDCPIPFRLANEQVLWLDTIDAAMEGWERVDQREAVLSTARGEVVVVGWHNEGGHGHVAVGVPSPGLELHIAQAGARNFSNRAVSSGFGSHVVKIWRHR